MAKARSFLNERRLTKKQVAAYLAAGAIHRPDLDEAYNGPPGPRPMHPARLYDLGDGRFLRVFDEADLSVGGKGDIYSAESLKRTIRFFERCRENLEQGKGLWNSSVGHWSHYSTLGLELPLHVPRLIAELSRLVLGAGNDLSLTYAGLDASSRYVEHIGFERAEREIYDHLVAHVGEVLRIRTAGNWKIDSRAPHAPYPFVEGSKREHLMPVNVVWSVFFSTREADLRGEAANESRRRRSF